GNNVRPKNPPICDELPCFRMLVFDRVVRRIATDAAGQASAMRIFPILLIFMLVGPAAASAAAQSPPRHVEIPRTNGTLQAQLYRPDGEGPFPVVIALHGCDGLTGKSEPVQARYGDWAEQLLKAGKAVLLPDSYGSRELGPQCRVNTRERRVLARR